MARTEAEELSTGARFRTSYLVEQADYTEELAKREATLLAPWGVDKSLLGSLSDLKSRLSAATRDRALAAADAQSTTTARSDALADAKCWLRKAILVGQNAYDDDPARADEFTKGGKTRDSVAKISDKMEWVLGLLRRDPKTTASFGASPAFLRKGDDLLSTLASADASDQHTRGDLTAVTRDLFTQKAALYHLLKRINRAGQTAHVEDPFAAAKYTLLILHRRCAKKEKAPAGAKA